MPRGLLHAWLPQPDATTCCLTELSIHRLAHTVLRSSSGSLAHELSDGVQSSHSCRDTEQAEHSDGLMAVMGWQSAQC